MKNKYINKGLLLVVLAAGLSLTSVSCGSEFLEDVENKGAFDSDNYYKNEQQVFTALVATYDGLRKYSAGFENTVTFFNAASDDLYSGGGSATDGAGIQGLDTFTINANTIPSSYWNDFYQGIARANILLERIDAADMSDDVRNRFKAEATVLRSLYYFELTKMFGRVPLILNSINGSDDFYNIPQSESSEIYAQIESDIINVLNDLPLIVSGADRGRVSQGTARAILGKIYLYDKKNNLAAEQLAMVNGNPGGTSQYGYKLVANYNDLWKTDNKFTTESVLEVMHTNEGRSDWGFWGGSADEGNSICIMTGLRSYTRKSNDAPELVSGWAFNPITEEYFNFMGSDPRTDATIFNAKKLKEEGKIDYSPAHRDTGYFLNKYMPTEEGKTDLPGAMELNFRQNYIAIRLADTYLMEAEALGGTGARAQALLDAVRKRVGLDPVPVTLAAIKNERRRELGGEGHRFFDLVRWGEAGSKLASKGFKVGKNEVLPIPYKELINTAIEQNPNY